MNKTLICLVGLICLFSYTAQAQYAKGDKLLNLGIGVNSYYNGGIPLSASFEVGVTDAISVGAGFDLITLITTIGLAVQNMDFRFYTLAQEVLIILMSYSIYP